MRWWVTSYECWLREMWEIVPGGTKCYLNSFEGLLRSRADFLGMKVVCKSSFALPGVVFFRLYFFSYWLESACFYRQLFEDSGFVELCWEVSTSAWWLAFFSHGSLSETFCAVSPRICVVLCACLVQSYPARFSGSIPSSVDPRSGLKWRESLLRAFVHVELSIMDYSGRIRLFSWIIFRNGLFLLYVLKWSLMFCVWNRRSELDVRAWKNGHSFAADVAYAIHRTVCGKIRRGC